MKINNIFISMAILSGLLFSVDLVVEPYLQDATPTSMTILLETDSASESIVEWGLAVFLTESTSGYSFTNHGNYTIHTVELTDLPMSTPTLMLLPPESPSPSNRVSS